MSNIAFAEKRSFIRMQMDCELGFQITGDDNHTRHKGHTLNLSGSGLAFITEAPITTDAILEIEIQSTNSSIASLKAKLQVIRVTTLDTGYEVAGQFIVLA